MATSPSAPGATALSANPDAWDEALRAGGGHLLQSWRWGELKRRFGWQTERIVATGPAGVAQAQVLFRRKAGVSIGYIPRGPLVPGNDPDTAAALWSTIDRVARRRRALTIIVEPDAPTGSQMSFARGLAEGPEPIQPSRTVKVPLLDDEALLAQMHQKTRYNVRLAQRRGVTVRDSPFTEEAVATFYRLLKDTADRNQFEIHSAEYYQTFGQLFAGDAALVFAEIEGRPVAAIVVATFGDEAIYMYGASSTRDRAHGAGFLIQFEAMRWARDRGCRRYDLWGIPAQDPQSTRVESGDRIAGTMGSDWRGLYEFKTRFGGEVISYLSPLERRYHPVLAALAARFYSTGGSG